MSQKKNILQKSLDFIEKTGNRLPDPATIFLILAVAVILISALLAGLGVEVTHPDGRVLGVQSLLATEQIRRMFTEMVKNFSAFPPLGLVLVTIIGIGVAEQSGYINAALKKFVTSVPKSMLSAALVFGGIMSNMAADAGYIVLTPLGAVLFAAVGRHPIAGLAAAFAGVSGGFSANLLITSLDPLLGGISTTAAQLVQPNYEVQASANYYFMLASTFFLTVIGAWVTDKIVEPRLGEWKAPAGLNLDKEIGNLSQGEKKGLFLSNITFLTLVILILVMTLPQGSVFHDEHGMKPFFESLVPIIMLVFLVCGVVFGACSGSIKSDKDVVKMASDQMSTMGGYIVLAFVMAQFIAYFSWSNLGLVIAVSGADFLKALGIGGIPLMIAFIFVTSSINLFIGSASAKWAIMGPVFIPMFMILGYSPELIQTTYRIGDSVTNIISPLLPYFPIIIAFAKKYSPQAGLGTLISTMIPYSVVFLVFWTIMLSVWFIFGIPLGPNAPLMIGQ